MLTSYRVLDLTDQQGMFCGYLLAHLDADVVAVEPPGGSSARRNPPLAEDGSGGLWWQAYARGKQSLVLDLETAGGRERLAELAAEADFLLESFSRQNAARYGIDYERYAAANPGLIMVSISPFGRSGPKADWPATDLTVWAASGAHILSGDADRAPVRPSVPQSFLHAGADAAGAALIALHERHKSGRGQHVDVSAQQSSAQAALSANLNVANNGGMVIERAAGGAIFKFPVQLTWPCKDGYVAITLAFGMSFDEPNKRLLMWAHERGACSLEDAEADWGTRLTGMFQGDDSPESYFELCRKIERFTTQLTMDELFDEGLSRGIYVAPTCDIAGVLEEAQFNERNFWHTLPGSDARVPGAFAKLPASPLILPGSAPALDSAPTGVWSTPRVEESGANSTVSQPLAGLKVLDFMWVAAGPWFTRVLADYGATVIKVESTTRLDAARGLPAFKDGEVTVDSSVAFNTINAGKIGITLDPSNPVGREVILDLVQWADVVTESFSPKAMKGWNLDYESLKVARPDLIMLSSCLMGQTGPRSKMPGYGNMAAAITGFYDLTGWPDRSPAGPYGAYTDTVAPRFTLVALMAAIEHRRRTGVGQYIDLSQAEAAIHFLAPAILDLERNGHLPSRMGNRDLEMCPHAVYPASGQDRWVAIVCQDDAAWPGLRDVVGLPSDEDLAVAAGRRAREAELDELISAWTQTREPDEIQSALIDAGVAAHVLQNSPECMVDPQLAERRHFVTVEHTALGEFVVEDTRFKLSRTPAELTRAGPELGEHNAYVLQEILGYDSDRIADIFASRAME